MNTAIMEARDPAEVFKSLSAAARQIVEQVLDLEQQHLHIGQPQLRDQVAAIVREVVQS